MNYIIESLKAVRRRTLDTINLDVEPPIIEKGMSWTKSIGYLLYFWGRRIWKCVTVQK